MKHLLVKMVWKWDSRVGHTDYGIKLFFKRLLAMIRQSSLTVSI